MKDRHIHRNFSLASLFVSITVVAVITGALGQLIHGYKAEERWIESLNDTNESDAQDHFGMRQLFGESTVSVESSNLFGLPWTGRVKMVSVRAGHLSNREIQIITNFHYLKTLAVRGQLTEKEKGILQDFRKRRPKVEFVHLPY